MSMARNHSETTINKYMTALKELKEHIDEKPHFGITTWCKSNHLNSATVKALRDLDIIESKRSATPYLGGGTKVEHFWIGGEVDLKLVQSILGRISEIKKEYKLSAVKRKNYLSKLEDKRKENSVKTLEAKIAKQKEIEELDKLPPHLQESEDSAMVIDDHLTFLRVLYSMITKHNGVYSNNNLLKASAHRYNINDNYIKALINLGIIDALADDNNGIYLIDWEEDEEPDFYMASKFKEELDRLENSIQIDVKPESNDIKNISVPNVQTIKTQMDEPIAKTEEIQDSKRPLIIELAKEFAKIEDYEFALILMRKLQ
jgi:hypothetical protein